MRRKRFFHLSVLIGTLVVLATAGAACRDGEESQATAEGSAESKEIPGRVDAAAAEWKREAAIFILPAPSEIVAILESDEQLAGLRRRLDDPLPSYRELATWQAALAFGRSIADLLILIPEASYPEIATHLQSLAGGLEALGADESSIQQLRELQAQVADGALGREQLVERFDLIRAQVLRRGDEEIGARNMALVAVGGWARAVNAVSGVARESGEIPAAADALKLRIVVSTLIDELGSEPEVQPVVQALERVLPFTDAVRPSQPTPAELDELIQTTDQILAYTRSA